MKTLKKVTALMLVFFAALIYSSCGKPDGGTSDTYIPDLSTPPLTWRNVADATNDFFFSDAPPAGTASGSFKAESFSGVIVGHANCTFNHSSVTFIFSSGAYSGKTFTGKINSSANPLTITLSSGTNPAVSFTLKKV